MKADAVGICCTTSEAGDTFHIVAHVQARIENRVDPAQASFTEANIIFMQVVLACITI